MINITILGATGSIGASALEVIASHPNRYQIFALTAYQQVDRLLVLCKQFMPRYAVLPDEKNAQQLQKKLIQAGCSTEVLYGEAGLIEVASAPQVDTVIAAIVGACGMPSTLAAAKAGKKILLANKETLVMAGHLFMNAVAKSGAILLPIDSEHNAIFQSLPHPYLSAQAAGVKKILLTASGGPFHGFTSAQLNDVTPAMACKHPNWSMGKKISIDSASLMNKGLEVIEAAWLFNIPVNQIEVVVHPQSIIHSMVQYVDGSTLAQMGNPDMRTPIAYALAYPERIDAGVAPLDFFALKRLDFMRPDLVTFPCLRLAYEALEMGGAAPAIINAANEVAVEFFLAGKMRFTEIPNMIEACLHACYPASSATSLEALIGADQLTRNYARNWFFTK
jgi:1-deoxy-D-xylulose-5-phosphate reductoisomerase